MMFSLIPPTGHKLFFKDIIPSKYPFPYNGYLFNSGTAALYFTINNLDIPPCSKIIIPAYSCPTVASAVLKAGHKPVLCDVNFEDLGYDLEKLHGLQNSEHPAAIIWVNLFGLQKQIPDMGIPIVLDNAQATPGLEYTHNAVAQVFSFGRGKPINALGGGMAQFIDESKFSSIPKAYESLSSAGFLNNLKALIKLFGYIILFNPIIYRLLYLIPGLKLGETIFLPEFNHGKIAELSRIVSQNVAHRLEKNQTLRKQICQKYDEILQNIQSHLHLFPSGLYYRYPVILRNTGQTKALLFKLQTAGIGAFGLYPVPLNRQPGLAEILGDDHVYPNAEKISSDLITLPINEFVTDKDIVLIQRIMKEYFHVR